MAAFSLRNPTWHILGISLFLLLVFLQMITSFVYYGDVFIQSNEVSIRFGQHDERFYRDWLRSYSTRLSSMIIINMFCKLVVLCLYVPVVLLLFALLAMLLAAYAKDKTTLRFSMACQAASSSLILYGLILFLLSLHSSYLNLKDMTLCFYIYVGVSVQLMITTLLTAIVSEKNLPPDWE